MRAAIALSLVLLAPCATAVDLQIEFAAPAHLGGDADATGIQRLLLVFVGEENQSAEVTLSHGPAWTLTHSYQFVRQYDDLSGGHEVPVSAVPVREEWDSTQTSLRYGRGVAGSVYIEATSIAFSYNGSSTIDAPGETGLDFAFPPSSREHNLFRGRQQPTDQPFIWAPADSATGPFTIQAAGVTLIEWAGAAVSCNDTSCPPDGGRSTQTVPGPVGAEVQRNEFVEFHAPDLTLQGAGRMPSFAASGEAPTLAVSGWMRLPVATGASACHECVAPENQTLSLSGALVLADVHDVGNRRLSAILGGDAMSVRLDEQNVAPALLFGRPAVIGTLATGAAVGLALLAFVLFSKHVADPLSHQRRHLLFEQIKAHPGATFRELARRAGLAPGVARHHLSVLTRSGLAVEHQHESTIRVFENHGKFDNNWADVVVLRNPDYEAIVLQLETNPGSVQQRVIDAMMSAGWSRSTTQHRLHRLVELGFVRQQKQGRVVRYWLSGVGQPTSPGMHAPP